MLYFYVYLIILSFVLGVLFERLPSNTTEEKIKHAVFISATWPVSLWVFVGMWASKTFRKVFYGA